MKCDQVAEVEEVQLVSVDQQELVAEHRGGLPHGACSVQQLTGLVGVLDMDTVARSIAEIAGDAVGKVVEVDHELPDPLRLELPDVVLEQRHALGDRHHRFGEMIGNRPQAASDARGQDECLHPTSDPPDSCPLAPPRRGHRDERSSL